MQSREYTSKDEPRVQQSLPARKSSKSSPVAAPAAAEPAASRAEFQRCMDEFRSALDELEQ